MKLNPNLYHKLDNLEPFRTETTKSGVVIDFYYLNDLDQDTYDNCIARKQLDFTTSINPKLIRVVIEKEAYELKKDLYSTESNELFIELLEKVSKPQRISKYTLIPAILVVVAVLIYNACVGAENRLNTWITFGIVVLVLTYMIVVNMVLRKKADAINNEYHNKFIDLIGQARFQEISENTEVLAQQLILKREEETRLNEDKEDNKEVILNESVSSTDSSATPLEDLKQEDDKLDQVMDDLMILDATITEENKLEEDKIAEEDTEILEEDELNIL